MPGRITELSETQIIADLLADKRRLTAAATSVQMPQPAKDTFTVAATPATTYTLSAIPYQGTGGSSLNLSLNGLELVEGVDYTVDYTTAVVTVSATLKGTPTPADVLTADYWTTGDLIALASAVNTGTATFIDAATATSSVFVSSVSVTIPTAARAGCLLVLAGSMRGTQDFTTPSGWTLAATNTSDGVSRLTAWYRICQTGDAGSTVTLTIAAGGTETPSVACVAYSGIDNGTPLFQTHQSFDVATSTAWGAGSLNCTTALGESLAVLIWGSHPAGSLPVTFDAAVHSRLSIGGPSNANMLAVGDELIAAGTTEPTRTLTVQNPGEPYVAIALAFTEG